MRNVQVRPWILAASLCLPYGRDGLAFAQSDPPPQSAGRVVGQLATGAVLAPVAFISAGWSTKHLGKRAGWRDETVSRTAYISAYTATWLAASSGPLLLGRDGKAGAALGGSLAGLGAAVLTVRLGNWLWDDDRRRCGIACWTLGAVSVALPSIGATAVYAASRR